VGCPAGFEVGDERGQRGHVLLDPAEAHRDHPLGQRGLGFSARLTVAVETPSAAATSFIVTRAPAGGIEGVTYGIAWPFSASRDAGLIACGYPAPRQLIDCVR